MEQQLAAVGNGVLQAAAVLLAASAVLGLWPMLVSGGKKNKADGDEATDPSGKRALTVWPLRLHAVAWALISSAMALMIGLFLADAFAFTYVAERSNRAMAGVYKVTALWAGQEGSLLLWLWIQAGFGLIVAWRANGGRPLDRCAAGILAAISGFFAVLVAWVLDPFAYKLPAPADGAGMNPILQSYWMTSHPVMLYLGYVGFSVPFAYALSSLVTGDDRWIRTTRRWSLVAWTFLSIGILYGARWAYEVLGWGGYWGWDPVENASFMPWLVATAFIHSGIIEEKRGMLRRWNHALVFITYLLTIFGTFVTRSGILSSVHAFVESDISPWFISYMGVIVALFLYALIQRWPELVDERPIVSPLSKESSFLASNVVMLATCFAIFWGTVFPLVAAAFGRQVTVGTPYFNRVSGPLFWAMIVLMGIGPLIAWRRASADNLKRQFTAPLINGFFMTIWLWVVGVRELVVFLSIPAVVFVVTTIVMEFAKGISFRRRSRKEPFWLALARLMNRNPGRYGGYIVHLGVVLVVVGVVLSQVYQVETNAVMEIGDQVAVGPYTIGLFHIEEAMHGNVPAVQATILVRDESHRPLGFLQPSKRFYPTADPSLGPMTQAAIYGTWRGDLYAILAGWEPFGSYVGFKFYYNPAVWLIWAGGGLLVFGALFSLWPRTRTAQHSEEERALAALAELEVDYLAGKVSDADYHALYAELSPKARRLLEREKEALARVIEELRAKLVGASPPESGGGAGGGGRKDSGTGGGGAQSGAAGAGRVLGILLLAGALAGAVAVGSQPGWAQPASAPSGQEILPAESPMGPGVAIPRETLVLRLQDGRLWVLDLVTVTNAGSDVVSDVQLPLAPGAEGLTVEGDHPDLEIAEGAVWDRRPLAPGESRRYTLQYSIFVFRWPHALQKPIVYPTAELLTLAIPEELVVGGLDLERGPAQIIAGQTLETQVSAWLAPGVSWQVIVRPGPLAGPLAGWNEGLLDLPVLAELDRFPGDWLIQRAARNPQATAVVLAVAALLSVGAALSLRKDRAKGSGAAAGESLKKGKGDSGAEAELASLARAVARLDLAFQQRALAERTYRRRRRALMRRLEEKVRASGAQGLEKLLDL